MAGARQGRVSGLQYRTGPAAGRPPDLPRGVATYLGPGADEPLWPALLLEFWSHASRNRRVREGVASIARFRRDALLAALQAASDTGVIRPSPRLDHCADLLLTIGDGPMTRAGTGQVDSANAYLPGVIAGVLGVVIGPRPVAASGNGHINSKSATRAGDPLPAIR